MNGLSGRQSCDGHDHGDPFPHFRITEMMTATRPRPRLIPAPILALMACLTVTVFAAEERVGGVPRATARRFEDRIMRMGSPLSRSRTTAWSGQPGKAVRVLPDHDFSPPIPCSSRIIDRNDEIGGVRR